MTDEQILDLDFYDFCGIDAIGMTKEQKIKWYREVIEDKKQVCESYFGDYKCHVATNIKDSNGRIVYVDKCLKEAIENLNAKGFKTVASCCGHGIIDPVISIEFKK